MAGVRTADWWKNWPQFSYSHTYCKTFTVVDHRLLCYDIYNSISVFDPFNWTFNKERNINDLMSHLCYVAKWTESGQRAEKQPNSLRGLCVGNILKAVLKHSSHSTLVWIDKGARCLSHLCTTDSISLDKEAEKRGCQAWKWSARSLMVPQRLLSVIFIHSDISVLQI